MGTKPTKPAPVVGCAQPRSSAARSTNQRPSQGAADRDIHEAVWIQLLEGFAIEQELQSTESNECACGANARTSAQVERAQEDVTSEDVWALLEEDDAEGSLPLPADTTSCPACALARSEKAEHPNET